MIAETSKRSGASEMSMPGFDAERSLYEAVGKYRGVRSWGGRAEFARSEKLVLQSWTVICGKGVVWNGATGQTQRQCYYDSQWRSATPLSECPGADKSGYLCYPFCAEGYHGVSQYCWGSCPEGYRDDGWTCWRDAEIIGADNSQCPWYDLCGVTLAPGCSNCPPGYANDGCTCRRDPDLIWKQSYFRGWGSSMSCPPGKQQIGALCYGDCPPGYVASGLT